MATPSRNYFRTMQCQSEEDCARVAQCLTPAEAALLEEAVNMKGDFVQEEQLASRYVPSWPLNKSGAHYLVVLEPDLKAKLKYTLWRKCQFVLCLADDQRGLGFGHVVQFDAVACLLAIGMAFIMFSWSENYGDPSESKHLMALFKVAAKEIAADVRIALPGAIQSLFECLLYTFLFLWTPALSSNAGYQSEMLQILSRITPSMFAIWLSSNSYDAHYSHMNLMACMTLVCLSCFGNMLIPAMQSVSYMVLALYIFGYHTHLQVVVPVLIVRVAALYKVTGDCLLFSYTWIIQQKNHLICLDALRGSYLLSFKEVVLIWVWGIWISIFFAQVDLFSWCSENSDLSRLITLNCPADSANAMVLLMYHGAPSTYLPYGAIVMVQPLLAQVANGQRYIPMKVSKTSDPRLQSWLSQFKVFTDRANIISDRDSLQKHFLATTIQCCM